MTLAPGATEWSTNATLATALGTLVLALAAFASVRSSNRSARIAEKALQEGRRPVLGQSRADDAAQQIMFGDGRWVQTAGGVGLWQGPLRDAAVTRHWHLGNETT